MFGRRQLLTGGLSLVVSTWLAKNARAEETKGKAKHVILLWMNGGPSHIDTWDPKTGKTAGTHKAIKTNVPGIMICEHMPKLAEKANKLAIVRGMTSKEGKHQRAQYCLRTGYVPNPSVQASRPVSASSSPSGSHVKHVPTRRPRRRARPRRRTSSSSG